MTSLLEAAPSGERTSRTVVTEPGPIVEGVQDGEPDDKNESILRAHITRQEAGLRVESSPSFRKRHSGFWAQNHRPTRTHMQEEHSIIKPVVISFPFKSWGEIKCLFWPLILALSR